MRRCKHHFAISVLTVAVTAWAGSPFGSGRLVEWIPSSPPGGSWVSAAIGPNEQPIVLYDPEGALQVPGVLAKFTILRQDALAFYAKRNLLQDREAFSTRVPRNAAGSKFDSSYGVISLGRYEGPGSKVLDCVAYRALTQIEASDFRGMIIQLESRGVPFRVAPEGSIIRAASIVNLVSDECAVLAREFQRERG